MPLVKAKTVADNRPITYDNPIAELIQRRRYQILVHSLMYYELDISLVEDHKWAEWGQELAKLQAEHPEIAEQVIFAEAFKGFDASTGFHLPFRDEQILRIAGRLLRGVNTAEGQEARIKLMTIAPTGNEWESYKKKSHKSMESKKEEVKKVESKPRKGLFTMPRG